MTININFELMPFNEAVTEFLVFRMNSLSNKHDWLKKAVINFKKKTSNPNSEEICEITLVTDSEDYKVVAVADKITAATKEAIIDLEELIRNKVTRFVA